MDVQGDSPRPAPSAPVEIYLSENAFVGLLVSTIEVYRRECFGILLGHRTPERVVVDFVVPYQSARRKFTEVHMNFKRSQRVEEAVRTTSRWELVGDYHSHPMYGTTRATTRLSKVDRENFGPGAISMVVAINDLARSRRWEYVRGGIISGSINGYSVRIGAYHKREGVIERVPIVCPYAVGFMERKDEA
jgi:proteasome lid subunit RPN8/RPN11